jgi:hypothetical protein
MGPKGSARSACCQPAAGFGLQSAQTPRKGPMKKPLLILGITVLSLFGSILIHRQNNNPKTIQRQTLESMVNIHGSPKTLFSVCGRNFPNPAGGPPYYLPVPGTNLIVFAYTAHEGDKAIVICQTNRCTFQEIAGAHSVFGNKIGYWEASDGKWGDRIEKVVSHKIFVSSESLHDTQKAIIDLDRNSIEVTETISDRNILRLDDPSLPRGR